VSGYIEAARAAERVGQRHLARSQYEEALRMLARGDELPTAPTILRWIAGSYFADANHTAAEDCVTAAIATAEAWGDEVAVGHAINMLGVFRWQQGELDEAVQLYNAARERAVHTGDAKLAAITAQNLGVIANIRGDFTRALQFYQAALADYRSMGLVRDVCIALNNLGMVYTDTERWDEAELAYREAIELVRDLRDAALRVQIEVNVVEMWVARREFVQARQAADAAMELAAQLGDAHVPGDAYRLLGVIERESGNLTSAESMLQRAAELAAARQDMLLLAETSRELAEVHRRQGRNRETLQALNRAHQLFTQLRARRDLADVDRQTTHLEGEFIDVVRRWGESIEAKDRYTQGHCERVADLACALAARSGFDERTLFWFRIGALLHDVGKLIIPAEVLNKPSKLNDDEWALMRRHPEAGVELLAGIDFPWDVRPLIESHHERWDGRGYPHGLAGDAIPLTARILCLADVFDALTSQRSYKQSMTVADAMEIMRRDVGRAFDPTLFELFERIVAERAVGPSGTDDGAADAARVAVPRPSRDDLTELPLRRACTAASTRLLAARRRDGSTATLLYLRVTDLNDVRQRLGQARADDLLATVAGVLRRASRRADVLARFGADDFVLLSDATPEQALGVAGRVRAQLTDGFALSGDVAPIAIGVATAPEHGDSLTALVAAARRAVETQPQHATRSLAMADSAADPPRPSVERFVGRVAELRRLEQMLDASLRGDARIMTVIGRTGIGKTALVSRLMLDARRRGAAHVMVGCQASAFPAPYAPWIQLIEALRAARVVPDRRWNALPRLVPSLAGSQRSVRLADGGVKSDASLADEICELLEAAAANRPLALVIEDVEHADHGSWQVCERLAARLSDQRLFLCLTTDDAHAAAARARFASCARHYELRLQGLAADDMRQWVGDLFADAATVAACTEHLAASGASTPLWSAHVLHSLVDHGHLAFANGTWHVADSAALGVAPLAANAAALLARRLTALSPKTRAILGELGVLGDGFEIDVALAAGIGDEAELLDAIDEALAAAILREEGAEPGAAFAFTHHALALAARETVDAMRLRRVHERIARGLEQVRPVALFEIAEHFDRAGASERAFEYTLLAAARAVSVQAYADAAAACERARAHVTTPAERRRLDELVAELPVRVGRAGVA
jgi:diguanylate cyclase (GGDEF)-like protein/putative nucleotidyltransferase with HDIG domain